MSADAVRCCANEATSAGSAAGTAGAAGAAAAGFADVAGAVLAAGADAGATGENPVIVACRRADVIVGPIGILAADSMLGEVTPAMALAVAQSGVKKLLLPVNHCDNIVVGVKDLTLSKLVAEAVDILRGML